MAAGFPVESDSVKKWLLVAAGFLGESNSLKCYLSGCQVAAGFLREIDSVHRPHLLKVAAENKSGCWTEEIFFCLSSESTYSEWLLGKWLLFVLFQKNNIRS